MSRRKEPSRVTGFIMLLFSLPFVGFGCFMSYEAIQTAIDYFDVQDWVETPAIIELVDDKDLSIRYHYQYNSLAYTSTQLGVNDTKVNGDPGYDGKKELLESHVSSGEPFSCFVDQYPPHTSVVFRHFRWGQFAFMIPFGLVFLAVGLGVMYGGWRSFTEKKKSKEEYAAIEADEKQKLMAKETWSGGVIESSTKSSIKGILFFAIVWNAISLPIAFNQEIRDDVARGEYIVLIAYLFPIVGVCLLSYLIYLMLKKQKYGRSVFYIEHKSGIVGGDLSGLVEINPFLSSHEKVTVELTCFKISTSGSGDSRRTTESILWQESYKILPVASPMNHSHDAIPILFDIPSSAQEVGGDSSDGICWRLKVSAVTPGIDYSELFTVPVFRVADVPLSSGILKGVTIDKLYNDPLSAEANCKFTISDTHRGGREYVFPMFRHIGTVLSLGICLAIFGGVFGRFLMTGELPIVFTIILGLVNIFLLYGLLDLIFFKTKLIIDDGEFTLNYGLFARRKISGYTTDIKDFDVKRGMQSGNTLFYNIVLQTTDGAKYTAACRLNKSEAEAIVKDMVDHL